MKKISVSSIALAIAAFPGVAFADAIDVSPVVNEAISDVLIPVALAVIPVIGGILVMPLRRFLDQNASAKLATSIDGILDRALSFAAKQGEQWVTDKDFHVNVDNWMIKIAADYAISHAPEKLRQVGALAAETAGTAAQDAAAKLLAQKLTARLPDHPAVAALKASVPAPAAVNPQLAAAA